MIKQQRINYGELEIIKKRLTNGAPTL